MNVRTRFAPSPTGFMHIGNLRTCLYAYLFAKHNGGEFILRIEDTDSQRLVEGAVDVIYRTLKTAKLQHDEGPDKPGKCGPYVQSERKGIYLQYAKQLVERGGAYYCFCEKDRLECLVDANGNRKYDKRCLGLSKNEVELLLAQNKPYVIRQNIPDNEDECSYDDMVFGTVSVKNCDMEDNILIKSDLMPTYNFANVVDDHLMEITHVIRGMEYLSSTPKYNLVYDNLGWQRPKYIHLPPIMKDATRKLSKRYGDANFEDFIDKGFLPEAIINYIALLGWSPKDNTEIMDIDELISRFNVEGVSHSSSIFDENKMKWLNGEYIKKMSPEHFATVAKEYFDKTQIAGKLDYVKLASLLIPRVEIFSEIADKVNPLAHFELYDVNKFENKKNKCTVEMGKNILTETLTALERLTIFTSEAIYTACEAVAESMQIKKGLVFLCLRLAVTGLDMSPGGGAEMCDVFGKEESLKRIKLSLTLFN